MVRPAMEVPSFDFVRSGVTTTTARWQSGCAFSKASTAVCASEAGHAFRSWDVLTPSRPAQRAAATASAVGGAFTDDLPKGILLALSQRLRRGETLRALVLRLPLRALYLTERRRSGQILTRARSAVD